MVNDARREFEGLVEFIGPDKNSDRSPASSCFCIYHLTPKGRLLFKKGYINKSDLSGLQ
jgi:hypothetical protein